MDVIPLSVGRVSTQMQGSLLLGNMQGNQAALLQVEQQIASGQKLSQASDDPAATVGIMRLQRALAANTQYTSSLTYAAGFLSTADSALGSVSDLVNQAKSIASSQIGIISTPDERAAQATVIDSLLSQAMHLANQQYQGVSVFGGQNEGQEVFASVGGGYRYQGSPTSQSVLTDTGQQLPYTVDGNAVFGGEATVAGYRDLTPGFTDDTRLSDIRGVNGKGVTPGIIQVSAGGSSTQVDLSGAATVKDVDDLVNKALTDLGAGGTFQYAWDNFKLTGSATAGVSISDVGQGTMAVDLGMNLSVPAGGLAYGAQAMPRITPTTPMWALNHSALPGSAMQGMQITNGALSATIHLDWGTTVEGLLNAINASGTQVRAEISADGTRINVVNQLSGSTLQIGENGGTTADTLGLRTFQGGTPLTGLNGGTGVTPIGATQTGPTGSIVVTRGNGTNFAVKMDGVRTPGQLIAAINAAGGPAVTAALNATGNGITLNDTSGGGGNLTVAAGTDYQGNGTDLGLFKAGTGGSLVGSNIAFNTDDMRVTRRDGTSFTVSFTGCQTVQDVLAAINNAAGNSDPTTQVSAALTTTGNGLVLTDGSSGGGVLQVEALNGSAAVGQLGLAKTAATGSPATITGNDVSGVRPAGLFTSLGLLRDALRNDDSAGITQAASLLGQDGQRVIQAQGAVGARAKDLQTRQDQLATDQTQLKSSLSLLADTDMTEAITRFQMLQTAYQGSLRVAQTIQQQSLLDFLQ